MTFGDILSLALNNLRRTKVRTALTTLGVVIGIAALTSMVSFGTGLEKNVTDVFNANDLFTSLTITSSKFSFHEEERADTSSGKRIPLNDSVIEVISRMPEVDVIYPEIKIPARIRLGSDSATISATGMPAKMGTYKPYSELMGGKFFESDSGNVVIVNTHLLRKLNLIVKDSAAEKVVLDTSKVRNKKKRVVTLDSVLGRKIVLSTASFGGMQMMMPGLGVPPGGGMSELKYEFIIGGVQKSEGFSPRDMLGGDLIIPIEKAKKIPSVGFTNVLEFLSRAGGEKSKYGSVYVRVKDMRQTDSVKVRLERMKLNVVSFSDELKEVKKGFMIIQSVLGVVGIISLFVAGLGIINTMLMSILERTREIGIMKAIGGSELQIRSVFFFEAATIGFFGGLGGLFIGWGITRIANLFVNSQITGMGSDPVNLFYFPAWLVIGAILFSILISLLAGLYPAIRASRIDPVEALRHN